jgi:hypothetical protein
MKKVKADYAKMSTDGKNTIKEKFNEQAKQVNIDTKELVAVLMKNREKPDNIFSTESVDLRQPKKAL